MAIKVSDYALDSSQRDSLDSNISSRVDNFSGKVGGATTSGGFFGIGASNAGNINGKAGITSDMVDRIRTAYDNYISTINSDIAQIENPEVNQAFKGTSIETAFKNLVTSVKQAAQDFTKSLQEAEMQIIDGVAKAYQSQDTSVSSDINNDAGSLGTSN